MGNKQRKEHVGQIDIGTIVPVKKHEGFESSLPRPIFLSRLHRAKQLAMARALEIRDLRKLTHTGRREAFVEPGPVSRHLTRSQVLKRLLISRHHTRLNQPLSAQSTRRECPSLD
jgi:hypothetical protein